MLAAADLPEEFQNPVAYFDRWLWFALLAMLVMVLYYAATLWFTRDPRKKQVPWHRPAAADPRREHLGEIDRVEVAARDGELPLRDAHQKLSEIVRGYVDTVTPLPARTMSLSDFKAAAPGDLAQAIALMYPPEFAPDDVNEARERFDIALHHARRLVTTWR